MNDVNGDDDIIIVAWWYSFSWKIIVELAQTKSFFQSTKRKKKWKKDLNMDILWWNECVCVCVNWIYGKRIYESGTTIILPGWNKLHTHGHNSPIWNHKILKIWKQIFFFGWHFEWFVMYMMTIIDGRTKKKLFSSQSKINHFEMTKNFFIVFFTVGFTLTINMINKKKTVKQILQELIMKIINNQKKNFFFVILDTHSTWLKTVVVWYVRKKSKTYTQMCV